MTGSGWTLWAGDCKRAGINSDEHETKGQIRGAKLRPGNAYAGEILAKFPSGN
jgi:hypothetical protein